jgi:hypothetical protein
MALSDVIFMFLRLVLGMFAQEKTGAPGATKKERVIEDVTKTVDLVEEVSTGGQKRTIERNRENIGGIIDHLANIMYPSAKTSEEDKAEIDEQIRQ